MVRLGDVATYVNGFAFKPADWSNKGIPIIRIQNLTGTSDVVNYYDKKYSTKYEINNGDVLIYGQQVWVYMSGKKERRY